MPLSTFVGFDEDDVCVCDNDCSGDGAGADDDADEVTISPTGNDVVCDDVLDQNHPIITNFIEPFN